MRQHLVTLALTKHIAVLLKRGADELSLLPQVRREESVGVGDGHEGSFEGILERFRGAGGGCVDVINTCELQQTLHGWRCDETGTTWSWDELDDVSGMLLRCNADAMNIP